MSDTEIARRFDSAWWGATVFGLALQTAVAVAELLTGASPPVLALLAAGSLALLIPARYDRLSAAAALPLLASLAMEPHPWGMWVVPHLLLFRFALHRRRAEVLTTAGLMAAVMFALALLPPGRGGWFTPAQFGLLALTAAAAGTGLYVQIQRRYAVALAESKHREQIRQEEEITRHVMAERMRIAHDLHDSVAHHIAVIGVHTSLARTTLHRDSAVAATALAEAQSSVRDVLRELQDVLRVLRTPEPGALPGPGSPPRDPNPGAADIPDLLDRVRRTGLIIEERTTARPGSSGLRDALSALPRTLLPTVSLGLYRVVQEALTNAQKYGDGRVCVTVDIKDGSLALLVTNRVPARPAPRTGGFGLIGMRERVHAAGGRLDVTQTGEIHRVGVEFPLPLTDTRAPVGSSSPRPPEAAGEHP
ncbi:sensor histidine kinase [Streptomyces scopuliridis]|uniref:sensor histidine kinase n=1 Tax=Streptomyces scopuliridis TaxID=452529 RepID=UPI0036B0813A